MNKRLPLAVTEAAPRATDGRNISPALGAMLGEAAQQRVTTPGPDRLARSELRNEATSPLEGYYGMPLLQPVVWKAAVPIYFYVGGVAGACSVLAAVAQLKGGMPRLVQRGRLVGALGAAASAALLIEDLGRPSRFLNMLRVFRPSSPMSVGSWVLSAFGATVSLAALLSGRRGALGAIGNQSGLAAGLSGLPLAGYTGVLLAGTAVPAWQKASVALPQLFIASAASSAAALYELLPVRFSRREEKAIDRFGSIAKAAELCVTVGLERELARIPRVVRPLRRGISGALWRGAQACVAASLLLTLLPGRAKWKRRTAGALGTIGAIATRLAVFQAGRRSALDARATFAAQN